MNGKFSVASVAAVSALVAGISGVVLGFVLSRQQKEPVKIVVEPAPLTSPSLLSGASSTVLLLATLENGESGKTATEGDRTVQINFTFETEDGRYCRAFGSRDASAAADGVACRNGTQWQVVAWDGTADPSEGFRSSELLDDVMDRLGGGAVLEGAEERELLERHWSAPQR
jgi:hypothetical protein